MLSKVPIGSATSLCTALRIIELERLYTTVTFFSQEFGFDPLSLFRPVVEPDFGQERFLDIEPMDAIREGKMHTVPYIISQTRNEFFWKAFSKL